jgi:phage head maturation protease
MSTPPRENLCRASFPGPSLRIDDDAHERGGMPTMFGHFTVFNQWAEIRSRYEGHFLERFAPGSLVRTFQNNGDKMRIMFQHGKDPQIGEKLLGSVRSVREDGEIGGLWEVPLFDTSYNRDLLPGLEAGVYGASMRFSSLHEEYVEKPATSVYNPDGIPERTIREARIAEAGPVVWPAYEGATAGVRSITDLMQDVDAVFLATPILLDEERLGHATAWIRRDLSEELRAVMTHQVEGTVEMQMDTVGNMTAMAMNMTNAGMGDGEAGEPPSGTIRKDAPHVEELEAAKASPPSLSPRKTTHTGKRVPIYGVTKEEPRWLL